MMQIVWLGMGLLIGSSVTLAVLCCLQINRINWYEREIRKLKRQLKEPEKERGDCNKNTSVTSGE